MYHHLKQVHFTILLSDYLGHSIYYTILTQLTSQVEHTKGRKFLTSVRLRKCVNIKQVENPNKSHPVSQT